MQNISKYKLVKKSESFVSAVTYVLFFVSMIVVLALTIANSVNILTTSIVSVLIVGLTILHIFLSKETFNVIACLLAEKYRIESTKVSSIRKPFPVSHVGEGVMVLEIEGGRTIGIPYHLARQLNVGDDILIVFVECRTYPAVIAKRESLVETEAT